LGILSKTVYVGRLRISRVSAVRKREHFALGRHIPLNLLTGYMELRGKCYTWGAVVGKRSAVQREASKKKVESTGVQVM